MTERKATGAVIGHCGCGSTYYNDGTFDKQVCEQHASAAINDRLAKLEAAHKEDVRMLDRLSDAENRYLKAEETLGEIAAIVHCGGLHDMSQWEALVAVRKLTLEHWDQSGTIIQQKVRVAIALGAADYADQTKRDGK